MRHTRTADFCKLLNALPKAIQAKANKQFQMLKADPRHPSLRFKKVSSKGNHWSVRVDADYRALGKASESKITWFWIGNHSDADKVLK